MSPLALGPLPTLAILGAGTAFPQTQYDNAAVLRATHTGPARSPEHLAFTAAGVTRTLGLARRAWAQPPGDTATNAAPDTPTLAASAARSALAQAGCDAGDVAALLVATSTPHRMTGTVSAAVGAALGLSAACQDLRAGCAGGLFAFVQGSLLAAAAQAPVLVVGVERFSGVLPPGEPNVALALGDGAAALLLGPPRPGARPFTLQAAYTRTDGRLAPLVSTPGPLPPTLAAITAGEYTLTGDADALAAALPARYHEAIEAVTSRAACPPPEVDLFLPHQTSRPLIEAVAAHAGIPLERTWQAGVERHANIGAAGALTALVEAGAEGRIAPGARVLLAAVGGGLSWAGVLLQC